MSTGTMKYKAKERYSFGYTDPRGVFGSTLGSSGFGEISMISDHFSRGMTADQLKAAWLIQFGDRPVSYAEIRGLEDEDIFRIGQELYHRMMLLEQKDFSSYSNIYVLKDKLEKTQDASS